MKITPSSEWSQENLIILLLEIHDWSLIFLEIKRIISTEISFALYGSYLDMQVVRISILPG